MEGGRAKESGVVAWCSCAVVQIWSGVKVFSAVSKGVGRGCEAALQTDLSVGGWWRVV